MRLMNDVMDASDRQNDGMAGKEKDMVSAVGPSMNRALYVDIDSDDAEVFE